jgi:hypothetical protein
MAKLYVTEFQKMGHAENSADIGGVPQVARLPALTTQVVTYTTSTASAAFGADTRFIRVHTDAACHILVADTPTATTSHLKMVADQTEYFAVTPGQKIAAVTAS